MVILVMNQLQGLLQKEAHQILPEIEQLPKVSASQEGGSCREVMRAAGWDHMTDHAVWK